MFLSWCTQAGGPWPGQITGPAVLLWGPQGLSGLLAPSWIGRTWVLGPWCQVDPLGLAPAWL